MDLFGIGGTELLVLLFLGGVLLGPRRIARLARDLGKLLGQIRALTGDLTKQLNREIDLLEAAEGNSGKSEEPGPETTGSGVDKLPEAYRRFRAEFPDEGKLDNLSSEAGRRNGQPGRPAGTPGAAQPVEAGAVAPASSGPVKD